MDDKCLIEDGLEEVVEEQPQKIKIINQLWTRKCNLSCDYCRIALSCFGNYICRPKDYPNAQYYIDNEKDADWWCELNRRLYLHNKEALNILYGGEIFFHPGHLDILKYLSEIGSNYTIITSANEAIVPKINKMFEEIGKVKGFTCSIDPGFWIHESNEREELKDDEVYKSKQGFEFLKYVKENDLAEDIVAEITVCNDTLKYLGDTIQMLSDNGIYSDITFVDVAKNNFYDFSSVTNEDEIIKLEEVPKEYWYSKSGPEIILLQCKELENQFKKKLDKYGLLIHMRDKIFDILYEILPSNGDCLIEENYHNMTIDSDGRLRLCLRIRGSDVPEFEATNVLDKHGEFTAKFKKIQEAIYSDKSVLCSGCNWTCPYMSMKGSSKEILSH